MIAVLYDMVVSFLFLMKKGIKIVKNTEHKLHFGKVLG